MTEGEDVDGQGSMADSDFAKLMLAFGRSMSTAWRDAAAKVEASAAEVNKRMRERRRD